MQRFRDRMTDGGSKFSDFTAVQRVRGDLSDAVESALQSGHGKRRVYFAAYPTRLTGQWRTALKDFLQLIAASLKRRAMRKLLTLLAAMPGEDIQSLGAANSKSRSQRTRSAAWAERRWRRRRQGSGRRSECSRQAGAKEAAAPRGRRCSTIGPRELQAGPNHWTAAAVGRRDDYRHYESHGMATTLTQCAASLPARCARSWA